MDARCIELQNRVIWVAGGTSGLGLSGARALVESGARVLISSRTDEEVEGAIRSLGENARGIAADATEPDSAERVVERAVAEFGRLDGLYHVAGGSGRAFGDGPLHEMTDEGWMGTLDLNLTSMMRSNRAAVRQMLKQGDGGSILNMGSVLAWSPSPQHFASHAYAAAKSGVIGFSKALASFYAKEKIRVNVVAPGLVETPMSRRAVGDEEILKFVQSKQPLDGGRVGVADDLDGAVVFLLSDAARFITGQTLAIDGGWTVSEGRS